MLQIPQSVFDELRRHGEEVYPLECCGILVGHIRPDGNLVAQAIPAENASPGDAHNHYQIAAADLIRIDRESRAAGLDILGFYHSHPDHPAEPSATDLAEAHWLGCSYLITEIRRGAAALSRSFFLAGASEEGKHFEPEEIQLTGKPNSHDHA